MDNSGRRFSVLDKCRVTTAFAASTAGEHGIDSMTVTNRYFNHTSHQINVKTRMGVNATLQPTRNTIRNERIEIHVDWQMSSDTFKRCERDLVDKNVRPDSLMGMVIRAFDQRHPRNRANQYSAVVVIEFSLKELMEAGGVVYLEEVDLLVSIGEHKNELIDHPFGANERLRAGLAASIPHLGKETFLMSIKAVDNSALRRHQDRFLLIGDEVHHIPIEADMQLQTGIHITTRHCALGKLREGTGGHVKTQFLSFDEADKRFGFADTIEKARSNGTWEGVWKEKLAEKTYEQKQWEQEVKDRAIEREDRINEVRARQMQEKIKDDTNKEEVKNFGDWMRIIGVTVTAAFTLVGIFAKMKPA